MSVAESQQEYLTEKNTAVRQAPSNIKCHAFFFFKYVVWHEA